LRKSKVYIALLHFPMYNKRMKVITTSVTNLDLHDISRAARTYDIDGFFVVHPLDSQRDLISQIVSYWQEGYGGNYNPDRREAFSLLQTAADLNEVVDKIRQETGQEVLTVATDARNYPGVVSYKHLKELINTEEKVFLLLFGTGWGIEYEYMKECNYILEPIEAGRQYNHLSVRSAVSIIMDRLLGEYWFQ